jgi:hypothetical protein
MEAFYATEVSEPVKFLDEQLCSAEDSWEYPENSAENPKSDLDP